MKKKMNKVAGLRAGPAIGIGGVAVAVLVAAGLLLRGPEPEAPPSEARAPAPAEAPVQAPEPAVSEPAAKTIPDPVPEDAAAPDPVPEAEAAAAPETAAAPEPAPEPAALAPLPEPPAIDTFRLEADGQMLVAGRTVPRGAVTILVDAERLGQTEADGAGKFVGFLDLPPSDRARALSLALVLPDGREVPSRDEILIAPTPRPAPPPATVAEAETPDAATQEAEIPAAPAPAELATSAPEAPPAPEDAAPAAPEIAAGSDAPGTTPAPEAPTVILSGESGVRVLQTPAGPRPEVMSSVALDAISYSEEGEVTLSGRASQPEGAVRIYVDNRPVTASRIAADGEWHSELPDVESGIYTLRVDEVSPEGIVTSRIETPFKREDPATLAARNATPEPPSLSVVTVQPGSTLWAISRERYGQGILYVRVFEANRDRIRDPDLIYPGQVFDLPE
jgi:nucleoid-associated protein YgaU